MHIPGMWCNRMHGFGSGTTATGIGLALLGLLLWGCASTVGPHSTPSAGITSPVTFPPYSGPKRKIQVVQINIPVADIQRYPELAEKRIGFGLSSILVETLFDTGRFTFLEEQEEMLKRLVEQWELTADGILVKDPSAQETALQAADFLVYAKVFDFVACSPVEDIGLTRTRNTCVTRVGVQVRIANTATGEYLPGSTNPLSPESAYVHPVQTSLFGKQTAFNQSAVGKATLQATRYAVQQMLQRFMKAGW